LLVWLCLEVDVRDLNILREVYLQLVASLGIFILNVDADAVVLGIGEIQVELDDLAIHSLIRV
jgi:hypothetical protein